VEENGLMAGKSLCNSSLIDASMWVIAVAPALLSDMVA
jgi:hypothetical protein